MKKPLEGRNIGFYLLLAAALAALAGAILYLVLDGEDRTFALPAFILALAGAVSTALAVFTRLKLAPLLPTALYAASAALVLRVALPSLSDVWNKVNFIGGNAVLGMTFAGVFLLCALLGVAVCFMGTEKR